MAENQARSDLIMRGLLTAFAGGAIWKGFDVLDRGTGPAIAFWILGIVLGIADGFWPSVRKWMGQRFTESANHFVTDFRWWFVFLAVTFLGLAIPGLIPGAPPTLPPGEFYLTGSGPGLEGKPLAFWWPGNLEMANSGETHSVTGYLLQGRNVGTEEITLDEAYLVSGIDSARLPLKIFANGIGYLDVKDAAPIPRNAEIKLDAVFANNGAMSETDFLREWESFSVVIRVGDEKIRRSISRETILSQIEGYDPSRQPHVTRRKQ